MKRAIYPCDKPGAAVPEKGAVILEGPDAVAITMTPKAAAETARRLLIAAEQAEHHTTSEKSND
jgi:hypothetical protein